jgi:uncharacterized protein GlcG (DUF336 family)
MEFEFGSKRLTYTFVTLDQAQTVVNAALRKGQELGLAPLSVAVLDAGGHLVAFARQDASSNLRPQIAIAKASGALALGVSSRVIGEMAIERPHFVQAAATIAENGVMPAAGGVLIKDGAGYTIGAIGVTGDNSDNDEICAFAGVSALQLPQS